jgi:hypothetical protein
MKIYEPKELIGHNLEIEECIFQRYRELRNKGVCRECAIPNKVNNGYPVSFFVVGEDFQKQQFRVIFIGKTVQGGWEDDPKNEASGFIDVRKSTKEQLFLPFWSTYPFWQCIKEIGQVLWDTSDPEVIWKRIAITDLVKCSTSTDLDNTSDTLIKNCQKAGFFENEVEIIKPTHLVLFTGSDYDTFLEKLHFNSKSIDETNSKDSRDVGGKRGQVKWWHRKFIDKEMVKMHFLRTSHPGYLKEAEQKENFCKYIAEWVRTYPAS